jgi:hypothetical protein
LTSGESSTDDVMADLAVGGVGAVGLDDEREFWRVEAAPGRTGIRAVVELCHVLATGTWTVTAIHD